MKATRDEREKTCENCVWYQDESQWTFSFLPEGMDGHCGDTSGRHWTEHKWVHRTDRACSYYGPIDTPLPPAPDIQLCYTDISEKKKY